MKSTMEMSFSLKRECDRGPTVTTMKFTPGMPDMFVIIQGSNRVELTVPELSAFRYVLGEILSIKRIVKDMDKEEDNDDY